MSSKAGAKPLKDSREEAYARELVTGKSQLAAYEAAGYSPDWGNAARAFGRKRVRDRVTYLRERAADKAAVKVGHIAHQYDEDREFAREHGNAGAAVSATTGKAKVLGLLVEKKVSFNKSIDDLTKDEIRGLLGEDVGDVE